MPRFLIILHNVRKSFAYCKECQSCFEVTNRMNKKITKLPHPK